LEDALKGLELFKLQGYSPLAKNADLTNKTTGQRTAVFRCHGCSFRMLLHHPFGERKDFWFTLGQKGVKGHSGHELKKPMRATKVLLEMMDDCKSAVAKDGSVGIELQKKTLNALNEALGGEDALCESSQSSAKEIREGKAEHERQGSS
jgi:hypothetical protein